MKQMGREGNSHVNKPLRSRFAPLCAVNIFLGENLRLGFFFKCILFLIMCICICLVGLCMY